MENESLLPRPKSSSIFFALASLALVLLGLIYFSSIFKPLVIAFLIWFIINQIKVSLARIKIKGKTLPSWSRSILAFLIILLVLYFITELLIVNIEGIAASMPEYIANFDQSYDKVKALVHNPHYADYMQEWIQKLDLSTMAASVITSLSSGVATSAVVSSIVTKLDTSTTISMTWHSFCGYQRWVSTSMTAYFSIGISWARDHTLCFLNLIIGYEYCSL